MADDTLALFFREADVIAGRIRERYQYRLKQEIAARERTIDIQVEKTSHAKANKLAAHKLEKLQAWNEAQLERQKLRHKRFEQFKGLLFWVGGWVGSGRSGIFFFISAVLSFGALGLIGGLNWPTTIACKSNSGGCYLFRFNKSTVIFPQQIKEIIAEYERNKSKPKRRR